jgi:hypothetical protein
VGLDQARQAPTVPAGSRLLKGYLNQLNAQAEAARALSDQAALVKQREAAAAHDRRILLDVRLKHLLSTIPPEVQAEGLSIVAVQVMLRPRGSNRSCCNVGQLADALRRLGFQRERRWRDGRSSFRALWRKRQSGVPHGTPSPLIEDA